ncbi:MAG: efflux transporter outer membrane subunit [Burkholderiales bacterium]
MAKPTRMLIRTPAPALWPASRVLNARCAALALLLSGCAAVGPNYQPPAVALESSFIAAGTPANSVTKPAAAGQVDVAHFWRGFNDAQLNALMGQALVANGDIRIAQARLQEARANRTETDAQALPGVGLQANGQRTVLPSTPSFGGFTQSRSNRTYSSYDASFVANWELDFFGRNRRASESAAALVDASEAGLQAAHVAVAAEVARNYLALRGNQQRLQAAQESLVNLAASLRITQARLDAGRGTRLDVARAENLGASTEATLAPLRSAIDQAIFRLATLSGQTPRSLLAQLTSPAPLPVLPSTDLATLPLGTPALWLARRPDLAVAERQLASSTALIGVAVADLYPRVSLSGLLGFNAATVGTLTNNENRVFTAGLGVTWTPFDLGTLRARIKASEARAAQSLARYEQTVAVAMEETEVAFSDFSNAAQQARQLGAAQRSAQEAAKLSQLRFDAGVSDFLVVLDAQRQALASQDQLLQAQMAQAVGLVNVYRVLGGGWGAN